MSIVVDIGDAGYCELKALELVQEARSSGLTDYNEKIARAISLLALARTLRNGSSEA